MTMSHDLVQDLFSRIGDLQSTIDKLEDRQRVERETATREIRRDVCRVEAKVEKINGTVQNHGERLATKKRSIEINSAILTSLPCRTDPAYFGATQAALKQSDNRWDRLINIVQILVLSVATAKLAGLF